ncbi:hypothetical protein HPB52_006876 [Rhipicephalus sanguineus]|uniref:Uncharacterized protein n=1 Tax=Rhipicephalus sanguineus TaxID=34632 RepID=A0A9D4Q4P7_RHISA|nr:hypothetical protein HPB52_006876 [Rhipicephalus sanguineus]
MRKHQNVCKDPIYNASFYMDNKFKALVTYDKAKERLFTYDSASTLRESTTTACRIFLSLQLCETRENVTNLKYTIVAQNIQFEDESYVCGHGPFSRLRMLKALARFFFYNYTHAGLKAACNSVA